MTKRDDWDKLDEFGEPIREAPLARAPKPQTATAAVLQHFARLGASAGPEDIERLREVMNSAPAAAVHTASSRPQPRLRVVKGGAS